MHRPLVTLLSGTAILLSMTGCSSGTPHGAVPGDPGEHAKGEHEKHGALPPTVKAFHEDLAPLWHADKGPDRVTKTCAAASKLRDEALAITTAPRPANAVESAWSDRAKDLAQSTTDLVAACEKEGRADFEARFQALHERFHGLVDLLDH